MAADEAAPVLTEVKAHRVVGGERGPHYVVDRISERRGPPERGRQHEVSQRDHRQRGQPCGRAPFPAPIAVHARIVHRAWWMATATRRPAGPRCRVPPRLPHSWTWSWTSSRIRIRI